MINIYMPQQPRNPLDWHWHHSVIVDWEPPGMAWQYVSDLKDADWIICVLQWYNLDKQLAWINARILSKHRVVFVNVYHSDEQFGDIFQNRDWMVSHHFFQQHQDRICFVDCNRRAANQVQDVVFYDFLWERQKVYFTQYEKFDLSNRIHTRFSTASMFQLADIVKNAQAKHYLAPMRVWNIEDVSKAHWGSYESRSRYRRLLRNTLDVSKGYISDHHKGLFIRAQEYTHYIKRDLENPRGWYAGGTWYPAHNDYYQDSFVSVYVETITFGDTYRVITEKTYDPLIKGNFILPMGYQGLVQDIRNRGFLLPDWIDYSYDILPDSTRFDAYLDAVRSLLSMDTKQLYELYNRDRSILEHNRSLFFSTPRVSLLDLIAQNFSERSKLTKGPIV